MQREGKYPLPSQASKTVMGVEFAGVITKLGKGVEKFKEGDEVFGLAFGVSSPSAVLWNEEVHAHGRERMPSTLSARRRCY